MYNSRNAEQNANNTATKSMLDALNAKGIRSTAPRRKLVEIISAQHQSFTAEAICEAIPEIGRATVYRTIRLLQEAGAICKVVMPNGDMAYSIGATSQSIHHHHAVCTICGSVRVFATQAIEKVIQALDSSKQLGQVIDHRIEIYDICPECT